MEKEQQPQMEQPVEDSVQPVEMDDTRLDADDDALDAEEMTDEEETTDEDEEIDPADVKIFGMPRVCFHGTAFGVAGGYIVSGLIGLSGLPTPSPMTCAVVCGGIGYLIAKQIRKKQVAAREAASAASEQGE